MTFKLTNEININQKPPFLDVLANTHDDTFNMTIYRKETSKSFCLKADSENVQR